MEQGACLCPFAADSYAISNAIVVVSDVMARDLTPGFGRDAFRTVELGPAPSLPDFDSQVAGDMEEDG